MPYTKLLSQECESLGIDYLKFHHIAYDEMKHSEICSHLEKAHYIIGVESMLGKDALLSDRFHMALHPDVNIISGKRSATIQSVSQLLATIASYYYKEFANYYYKEFANASDDNDNRELITNIINTLKDAANRSITSRLGIHTPRPVFNDTMSSSTLEENKLILAYLAKKLTHLTIT